MKVLVTGAEGQLARSLVERSQFHPGLQLLAIGRPDLDFAVSGSAATLIQSVRPDVVINAAAYTAVDKAEDEPDLAFRINAEAAGEVAETAATTGTAVIQISTDYVFDGSREGPYDEAAPTSPLGVYGRSKLEGEERVRAANPRHAIVRTAWVYSPFGSNFVKTMMNAAHTRDLLTVVDDQVGSPTSALDLADGLLRMIDAWAAEPRRGLGATYHLGGSGKTTWCGLAGAIMAECAKRSLPTAEVRPIATSDWPTRAQRPANSVLGSGKFALTFGFEMPDWRDSVATVVARLAEQDQ